MLETIIRFLINPPEEQLEEFLLKIESISFKKNDIIINENQICDKIYFVKSGALNLYSMKDGNIKNYHFAFENDFITEFHSFLEEKPAKASISSLEDSEVLIIKKSVINSFYQKYPIWEKIGRILAERQFLMISKIVFQQLSKTPEERYKEVMEKKPQIIQRIPQYHIASYLGIKPETLSRIRARI